MLGAGSLVPMTVTRLTIGPARPGSGTYPAIWQFHSLIGVDPLQTTWLERGTVSGRVALLLRSAEIQPLFDRFVRLELSVPIPSIALLKGGVHAHHPLCPSSAFQYRSLRLLSPIVTLCSKPALASGSYGNSPIGPSDCCLRLSPCALSPPYPQGRTETPPSVPPIAVSDCHLVL